VGLVSLARPEELLSARLHDGSQRVVAIHPNQPAAMRHRLTTANSIDGIMLAQRRKPSVSRDARTPTATAPPY